MLLYLLLEDFYPLARDLSPVLHKTTWRSRGDFRTFEPRSAAPQAAILSILVQCIARQREHSFSLPFKIYKYLTLLVLNDFSAHKITPFIRTLPSFAFQHLEVLFNSKSLKTYHKICQSNLLSFLTSPLAQTNFLFMFRLQLRSILLSLSLIN